MFNVWTKQIYWVVLLTLFDNDGLKKKPENLILYNSYSIQIINLSFVKIRGGGEKMFLIYLAIICVP